MIFCPSKIQRVAKARWFTEIKRYLYNMLIQNKNVPWNTITNYPMWRTGTCTSPIITKFDREYIKTSLWNPIKWIAKPIPSFYGIWFDQSVLDLKLFMAKICLMAGCYTTIICILTCRLIYFYIIPIQSQLFIHFYPKHLNTKFA